MTKKKWQKSKNIHREIKMICWKCLLNTKESRQRGREKQKRQETYIEQTKTGKDKYN